MSKENDCVPKVGIPYKKWFMKIDQNIGEESSNGKVYQICKNDENEDCTYVMKVIKIDDDSSLDVYNIEENLLEKGGVEVMMQNACAEHELCLPVEDSWNCDNGKTVVIITKMARETLYRFLVNEESDKIITKYTREAIQLIKDLHLNGIYHGDTHLNNFMFTHDDKLKFIDLGSSLFLGESFDYDNRIIHTTSDFFDVYTEQILEDYIQFSKYLGYIGKRVTQYLSFRLDESVSQLRGIFLKYAFVKVIEGNIS